MLEKLNEYIKGWLAGVVLIVVSASFVLWGVEYYVSSRGQGADVVATVNKEKITKAQVSVVYQQLQQRVAAGGTAITPMVEKQLKAAALENLIGRKLLLQAAQHNGFRLNTQQVNSFIAQMPEFSEDGRFSQARLLQLLAQNGLTLAQFSQQVRDDLLLSQVTSGLQASAFVLPKELANSYRMMYEKRDFSYVIVSAHQFLHAVNISDKMLNNYYASHPNKFKSAEMVQISYIQLSAEKIKQTMAVSDQAVQQYYQSHIDNYKTPQQWRVARVFIPLSKNVSAQQIATAKQQMTQWLMQINQGKLSFATLMKQQQGFTETLAADEISEQMFKILTSLKLNELSQPFLTAEGYNVVRLVAVQSGKTRSLSAVRQRIRKLLLQQKVQTVLDQQNEQLSNLTYTHPDSLQPAADALKLPIRTSAYFSREGSQKGMGANKSVITAAFSEDVLKQGMNSEPIILSDGRMIVLRVAHSKPSQMQPFSAVRQKIHQQLTTKMTQVKAALLADQVQRNLLKGMSMTAAVDHNIDLVWSHKQAVLRGDKNMLSTILLAAFQCHLTKTQSSKVVALPNGDTAVVLLTKIIPANYNEVLAKDKQRLQQQLTSLYGQLAYRLYMNSVRQQAKVKIFLPKVSPSSTS